MVAVQKKFRYDDESSLLSREKQSHPTLDILTSAGSKKQGARNGSSSALLSQTSYCFPSRHTLHMRPISQLGLEKSKKDYNVKDTVVVVRLLHWHFEVATSSFGLTCISKLGPMISTFALDFKSIP